MTWGPGERPLQPGPWIEGVGGGLWPGPGDLKRIPQVLGNKSLCVCWGGREGGCFPPLGLSASLLRLRGRLSSRRLGPRPMFSAQLETTESRNEIIMNVKFYSEGEE